MFGKSSFINKIAKKTTQEVENRPGVTKQKQWIRINDKIELLDTPEYYGQNLKVKKLL